MARNAPPERSHAEVFRWLLEAEETEARHSMPQPSNARHLAALQAGRPVDICAGDLPEWARAGEPTHWWRRVIATAAGAVEFYNEVSAFVIALSLNVDRVPVRHFHQMNQHCPRSDAAGHLSAAVYP
jgi:hypothetical protein